MKPTALQRIGVTGGRGRIAHYLIRALQLEVNCPIVSFDSTHEVDDKHSSQDGEVINVQGDVLSLEDLCGAFEGCDCVFHLAGKANAGESASVPLTYFEVNSHGTAFVWEACRRLGIKKGVYVSTSHVYGMPQNDPITEDHQVQPLSMYASSKLVGEEITRAYRRSFGMNLYVARLSNVYGGRLGKETAIGTALSCVVERKPIYLQNVSSVRDFIFAGDVADALIRIATEIPLTAERDTYNVSSGTPVSIAEVVEELKSVIREIDWSTPPEIHEQGCHDKIKRIGIESQLLREVTSWRPKISLRAGLNHALQELIQLHSDRNLV